MTFTDTIARRRIYSIDSQFDKEAQPRNIHNILSVARWQVVEAAK